MGGASYQRRAGHFGWFKSATGVILNAASAFGKLNTVMKASVIGAVVVGVTALYLAYDHFANSLTDAERAQASVLDVTRRANEGDDRRTDKGDAVNRRVERQHGKAGRPAKALKELQAISPQYFGNLDLENRRSATSIQPSKSTLLLSFAPQKRRPHSSR